MSNSSKEKLSSTLFQLEGIPPLSQAIPLAFQHVVAMIVGCVTPAIIVANVVSLDEKSRIILIQASLVVSAISTFLQIFGFWGKIGSGLPVIMGVSFAYVPTLSSIAHDYGISYIFGAQIIGGIVAFIVGVFIKSFRKYFPPLITGTVVFTIGLSLYPTAVNYMAGGLNNKDVAKLATPNLLYGSVANWSIAILTLAVVIILNHYGKGILKLASILIGMGVGYLVAFFCGMVDLSPIFQSAIVQLPKVNYFGIKFNLSSCIAIGLLFAINAIQAIGDYTATTVGGLDREPTMKELQNGITTYGLSNLAAAFVGGLPTATYSQNVGVVSTTKVVNRIVFAIAAFIILMAGLMPKFSALLTTIPQCVLGGATISVFASIAMTGMRLLTSANMNSRNASIVGLSAALGVGISQASSALAHMPQFIVTVFGKSPVVVATLLAIFLNLLLPEEREIKEKQFDDVK